MLVNAEGESVVGEGPVNQVAFAIHAAIHEARPDVVAAAHTHSLYGKAWSTLGRTLDPSESSGRAAVIERRVDVAPLWTDAFWTALAPGA